METYYIQGACTQEVFARLFTLCPLPLYVPIISERVYCVFTRWLVRLNTLRCRSHRRRRRRNVNSTLKTMAMVCNI